MPAKNKIKIYLPNSVYHVYNRGVEKREIFRETNDYSYFIGQIKGYLLPRDEAIRELTARCRSPQSLVTRTMKVSRMPLYCGKIRILAFALIPNHFHMLVRQIDRGDMTRFMRSLGTSYSMYFNRKYKRVGQLCQDVYKARLIRSERDLLKTSAYIHRNPLDLTASLKNYPYSSLRYYASTKHPSWITTHEALDAFRRSPHYDKHNSYFDFVKDRP